MPKFAPALWAIPIVQSDADRLIQFPTPEVGQRVQNLATGSIERWDGTQWLTDFTAGLAEQFYGIVGDGVTDDSAAINAMLVAESAAGRPITLTKPVYNIGTTGLTLPTDAVLEGYGRRVQFNYAGTGVAIDGWTHGFGGTLRNLYVLCANDAASGLKLGNGARYPITSRVIVQGSGKATVTGAGIVLDGANGGGAQFSGFIWFENVQSLGFKYGMKVTGASRGAATWTMIAGINVDLIGRSAGIVPGSRGIWCDTNSNCEGSRIHGSIEAFEQRVQYDDGGSGIEIIGGFEGNGDGSTIPVVPTSFSGEMSDPHSAWYFRRTSAGVGTFGWHEERILNGLWDTYSRYSKRHTFYASGGDVKTWGVARSDAQDTSGTANLEDLFMVSGGGLGGYGSGNNWVKFPGDRKVTWETKQPDSSTGGDYARDSIIYRAPLASGQPMGWACTASGSLWTALSGVTGSITSGTNKLTVNDASSLRVGAFITIAGVTGTKVIRRIVGNDVYLGWTLDLTANANATVSGAAVAWATPSFTALPSLP